MIERICEDLNFETVTQIYEFTSINKSKYWEKETNGIKISKSAPSLEYRLHETKEIKILNRRKRIKIIIEFNYSAII